MADVSPLVEREVELAALRERLALLRAQPGHGGCVVVHGEAGVGKTSLLQAAARESGDDVAWWWGACEPLLSAPPLGPLLDLIDALPPSLAAAIRSGQQAPQVLAGMLAQLRERARPTVLVIDDAQWADGATLDLLRYLGRRIAPTRALLVIAHRDEVAPDHPLRVVLGSLPPRETLRLGLHPLSPDGVGELARRAGRDPRGLHATTAGNPFFVTELLAGDARALPVAVRDAVLARCATLPGSSRDLLELVSVGPAGLEIETVDAVIDDAAEAIDACVVAGLLRREQGWLRFRHDLARRGVESSLTPQRAATLHGAVFDALQLRGAPPTRLVHHAAHAGVPGAVLQLAPVAAREASDAAAHRQAAALYRLALDHAGALDAAPRAALWMQFAQASFAAQRLADAFEGWREALALRRELGDPLAEGCALRHMAHIEWLRGAIPQGLVHVQASIERLERLDAPRELAMAYATVAQLHLLHETPALAIEWGRRALATLEPIGDPEGLTHALCTVGFASLLRRETPQAWADVERSLALARQHRLDAGVSRAYVNLASLALVHRRLDRLHAVCAEGIAWCEARDLDMSVARLRIREACALGHEGRWGEARESLQRVRAMPVLAPLEDEQSAQQLVLLDLREGRIEAADFPGALAEARRSGIDPWYAPRPVAAAEAAWLCGDAEAVAHVVREALPGALRGGEGWRIGQLACWLRRVGVPVPPLEVAPAEPCALELDGDIAAAAACWAARGCRYEEALVLAHGDAGQQQMALALFEALGAGPAARLVRRRLRDGGGVAVPRGPYAHRRADALGLTARERQVFDLVAQGLSNRAIAQRLHRSERTVENHVSAVLGKLGVQSRADAVARAAPGGVENQGLRRQIRVADTLSAAGRTA